MIRAITLAVGLLSAFPVFTGPASAHQTALSNPTIQASDRNAPPGGWTLIEATRTIISATSGGRASVNLFALKRDRVAEPHFIDEMSVQGCFATYQAKLTRRYRDGSVGELFSAGALAWNEVRRVVRTPDPRTVIVDGGHEQLDDDRMGDGAGFRFRTEAEADRFASAATFLATECREGRGDMRVNLTYLGPERPPGDERNYRQECDARIREIQGEANRNREMSTVDSRTAALFQQQEIAASMVELFEGECRHDPRASSFLSEYRPLVGRIY